MQSVRALVYVLLLSVFSLSAQAADQDRDMVKTWRQAQTGDMEAQFSMGYLYQSLADSQQELQAAIHWYQQAAASGHARAAFALGLMHEHGQGVEKNLEKAIDWYERAARIYAQHGAGYQFKLAKDAVSRIQPESINLAQRDRKQ
jgi:TPR repeat protein